LGPIHGSDRLAVAGGWWLVLICCERKILPERNGVGMQKEYGTRQSKDAELNLLD